MSQAKRLFKIIQKKFGQLNENKHFKQGLPFVGFLILGVSVLRLTQSLRYEFRRVKTYTKEELEELEKIGVLPMDKLKTIEEVYEEIKDVAEQDWHNVRIPRPWDETAEN